MPVYLNVIDVLGKKLYSGKVAWIREYVQNSLDARSNKITIRLHDNDLTIEDNGEGISKDKLDNEAFSPGGSSKSPNDIGELGVGLYAGTGICKEIRILSKQRGNVIAYEARFDVTKYRDIIKRDRFALFDKHFNSIYTVKEFDQSFPKDDHFTKLSLIGIEKDALDSLKEEVQGTWFNTGLKGYIEKTVNCPLSESFPLKEKVQEFLTDSANPERNEIGEKESLGNNSIRQIYVDVDGNPVEIKKFMFIEAEFLDQIYTREFKNSKGEIVAKVWAAYSKDGSEFNGSRFVVKFKGMTVGDESSIYSHTGKRVEKRLLGEAIALNNELQINTERDWFIDGPARKDFEKFLSDAMSELYYIANSDSTVFKQQIKLAKSIVKIDEELKEISPNSTIAKDKLAEKLKISQELEILKNIGENKTESFIVDKRPATKSALELMKEIKLVREKDLSEIIKGSRNLETKETGKEIKKRISPIPKTVKNFLTERIVDEELRDKIRNKEDVKDISNNAFTYVETLLKTRLEIPTKQHVEFPDLVKKFLATYNPVNIPEKEVGKFKEAFSQFLKSNHYFWKNPSSHEFMEDMRDDRFLFQAIMIADFVVKLINDFKKK